MNHIIRLFLTLFLVANISCKPSTAQWEVSIANYKDDKACAISYTFDDGMKEHYTLVAPMMDKHGFKGTFWVVPGYVERNDGWTPTWEELKEMAVNGHEMSNHSMRHKNLTELSQEEVYQEIAGADSLMFERMGVWPTTFCFPFNAVNEEVIGIAGKGRIGMRLSQTALGTNSTPENLTAWVDGLFAGHEWGIAMIHGITHGYDAFTSPVILSDHFDYVKQREGDIWVGTFKEISAYTAERENVVLDMDRQGNTAIVRNTLTLDRELFNDPLTMVIAQSEGCRMEAVQDGKTLPVNYVEDKVLVDFVPGAGEVVLRIL